MQQESDLSPKKHLTENAMRDLSTALCRGFARQVVDSMPLPVQARMDGWHSFPDCLSLPTTCDDATTRMVAAY